ncbi:MAG: hypothetical protein FJ138_05590 [Deltaproteobacteria bacterium]|nr:hypothetical protein [Deltaproteobacteria bacterium]
MQVLSTEILNAANIRLDFDGTTLLILVIFVALHRVLKTLVFTPFLSDLDARDAATERTRAEAKELAQKAEELAKRHAAAVDAARADAEEARRALRVEGLAHKEERVSAARAEADASYAAASSVLREQFAAARAQALSQVDALAKEIKTKVLGA